MALQFSALSGVTISVRETSEGCYSVWGMIEMTCHHKSYWNSKKIEPYVAALFEHAEGTFSSMPEKAYKNLCAEMKGKCLSVSKILDDPLFIGSGAAYTEFLSLAPWTSANAIEAPPEGDASDKDSEGSAPVEMEPAATCKKVKKKPVW